jgi:hypothetical protein
MDTTQHTEFMNRKQKNVKDTELKTPGLINKSGNQRKNSMAGGKSH